MGSALRVVVDSATVATEPRPKRPIDGESNAGRVQTARRVTEGGRQLVGPGGPTGESAVGEPVENVVPTGDDAADDLTALMPDREFEHVPHVQRERDHRSVLAAGLA